MRKRHEELYFGKEIDYQKKKTLTRQHTKGKSSQQLTSSRVNEKSPN